MVSAKLWGTALTACALATSLVLVGCGKKPDEAKQGAEQKMPPTEVGVLVAQPQNIEQHVDLPGRVSAYEISEVRPQTSGVILKRLFVEGSYVRQGQALYELDPNSNEATVANAKAALLQQQANLNSLSVKMNRYKQLVASNAVSKQEYDDLVGQVNVAKAQVTAAQAEVRNAQINLGYSTIRAPISGRTNSSTVTVGALVTANQANPMVTIQRLDPVYVNINQSSAELLRLRQQLSKGQLDNSNNTSVKLMLEDGSEYPTPGRLDFSGASVDPDTGTVTLRGIFPNPNNVLLPGMYATARISQGVVPDAYLVPQVAVSRSPTGQASLFVVNQKGAVEPREITTKASQGTNWIVTEGLKPGERIVVEGVAKVKEGQSVTAKPYQMPNQDKKPATPNTNGAQQQQKSGDQQAQSNQKPASNA